MPTATPFKEFKRGATFSATANWTVVEGGLPNLIGCTVTSSILDQDRKRRPLTVTVAEDGLSFTMKATASQTEDWAIGDAYWDIRFSYGSEDTTFFTKTYDFTIVNQITL